MSNLNPSTRQTVSSLFTLLTLLLVNSGCLIIRDGSNNSINIASKPTHKQEIMGSVGLYQAQLGNDKPDSNSTLFLTTINYSRRVIVNLSLDSVGLNAYHFKAVMMDFAKTNGVNVYFDVVKSAFDSLHLKSLSNRKFILIKAGKKPDTLKETFVDFVEQRDTSNLFHFYSGKLVGTNNDQVNFWAQTDPVSVKIIVGAEAESYKLSNLFDEILSSCSEKIKQVKSQCAPGHLKIVITSEPILDIMGIWQIGQFNNCTVTCNLKK